MGGEEKGKITLECETRRVAKRVTWLKGMAELRAGRKYVMKQKGVILTLTISSLERGDTDVYTCDVGTMQSRALLTVYGEVWHGERERGGGRDKASGIPHAIFPVQTTL